MSFLPPALLMERLVVVLDGTCSFQDVFKGPSSQGNTEAVNVALQICLQHGAALAFIGLVIAPCLINKDCRDFRQYTGIVLRQQIIDGVLQIENLFLLVICGVFHGISSILNVALENNNVRPRMVQAAVSEPRIPRIHPWGVSNEKRPQTHL